MVRDEYSITVIHLGQQKSSIDFDGRFVAAFGLHLPMDGVQPMRSHFHVGRTYVTGVPKICGRPNH